MKWVIQEDVFDENYVDDMEEALADLGLARGTGYEIIKYVPFAEPSAFLPIQPDNNVIVYGSINLLKQVQSYTQWKPGAGVTWDNYKCSEYYKHFGNYVLNKGGHCVTLKELPSLMDKIGGPRFIRPDAGDKAWVGGVYDPYEARRHAEYVASRHGGEMLMHVCAPCPIDWEARYFCIENEVITGSLYRIQGKRILTLTSLESSTEVKQFVNQVLAEVSWRPDPVFALDLCASGGNIYIMELSAYHCAGLYKCDIKKLSTRVHKYYEARK
jgi:hypothetical protein